MKVVMKEVMKVVMKVKMKLVVNVDVVFWQLVRFLRELRVSVHWLPKPRPQGH